MPSFISSHQLNGRLALVGAFTLIFSLVDATSVSCAVNAPLSCQNTTAYDTCCFNFPGGDLLQTQFWDTNPATGPSNSWTIHGLWPDHCDGTFDSNCDDSRAYTDIAGILRAAGETSTLSYMQTYWKDYQGNDETFWEHEWGKHGTCISTLDPTCYINYQSKQEAVDFFARTINLFQSLPSYAWLALAGIVPSASTTYTSAAIQSALQSQHGYPVTIRCNKNGELNEIWYHFNVQGSVQKGTFMPANPVGSGSNCAASGVKYLPKPGGTTTLPTLTSSNTPPTSTSTSPVLSGKGFLNVVSSGAQNGCIISGGTWYTTSSCARFTATPSGSGFTLTSSKGKCAISSNTLTCASTVTTSTVFTYDGTYLVYSGSPNFYATDMPSGNAQTTVYSNSHAVALQIKWQAQ